MLIVLRTLSWSLPLLLEAAVAVEVEEKGRRRVLTGPGGEDKQTRQRTAAAEIEIQKYE